MCDSEFPYDLILGWTSMAQLSAWQDYSTFSEKGDQLENHDLIFIF